MKKKISIKIVTLVSFFSVFHFFWGLDTLIQNFNPIKKSKLNEYMCCINFMLGRKVIFLQWFFVVFQLGLDENLWFFHEKGKKFVKN